MGLKLYDILVVWLEWGRGDYVQRQQWVRSVPATTLTEAGNEALTDFADRICPSVSMGWSRWPEKLT